MKTIELAALLYSFNCEMDAPLATEQFRALLEEEHRGDCTKDSGSCVRCWAEHALLYARRYLPKEEGDEYGSI